MHCYRTEKNLVEHKDKIPEDVRTEVQKAIDDVKAVQESEDAEDIKAKVQALQVRGLWNRRWRYFTSSPGLHGCWKGCVSRNTR